MTTETKSPQPGPALQVAVQRALSAWDTTTLKTNGDGMLCEAMESLRAEFDSAVMLNGLTEAETSQTASVMGLVGERTSVNDGALVFARVMEYQGKTRRQVVNPCLTARECIALANYIHASDRAHLTKSQAPEGAQALLVQALEDIIEPFAYIERNLPEGYRLDGQAALQQINSREFYTRIAKEALAAHRAALAAPAPQAPGMVMVPADPTPEMVMEGGEVLVPHTTEFLASLCEQAETVYRAMLAAAPQTKEPTNDR